MIKVLNCFKIVPDIDKVAEDDWSSAEEKGTVDTSYLKSLINYYDEGALELACRFSDKSRQNNIGCSLSVVTVGDKMADNVLKTLMALGFSYADRIASTNNKRFEPEYIATVIEEHIKKEGNFDLIIMGMESADGNNGRTPYILAEKMDIPCICQVIGFEPIDEKSCNVTYMTDEGSCSESFKMPLLLAVGDVPASYLRVPTLKQRMAVSKQAIRVSHAEACNEKYSGEHAELESMKIVNQSREGIIIDDDNVHSLAEKLSEKIQEVRITK